jgi:hypothetical protein
MNGMATWSGTMSFPSRVFWIRDAVAMFSSPRFYREDLSLFFTPLPSLF